MSVKSSPAKFEMMGDLLESLGGVSADRVRLTPARHRDGA